MSKYQGVSFFSVAEMLLENENVVEWWTIESKYIEWKNNQIYGFNNNNTVKWVILAWKQITVTWIIKSCHVSSQDTYCLIACLAVAGWIVTLCNGKQGKQDDQHKCYYKKVHNVSI